MYNLTCMDMEGVHTRTQKKHLNQFYSFVSLSIYSLGIKLVWHMAGKASKLVIA